ncbi:unnamed protein product [Mytilus edulis]|uniref:Uncharacterized protein n=1 Tax=Mytilus edulis TaxID=6550 RepID=A0A8S3UKV4_MYTED|nr:unnamed protein product [Mytilus edulis]
MMESNAGNQNMEEDIVELLTKIDHRLSVIEGRTDKIESIDRKLSELTSKVTSIEKEVDNIYSLEISIGLVGQTKIRANQRLIVAKFVYFADLRKVLEAGPKLKEKPQFGMNLQFPIEIEERRRKLYPVMKDAKRNGKRVSLIRDKLIIEGKVYNSKTITEESQTSPKENNDTESRPNKRFRTGSSS